MARYLETAAEANQVAKQLLDLVAESDKPKAAEMIARLVNLGIRCSPRGVQHTVRLNAVRTAVKDLPVRVSMKQVTSEKKDRYGNQMTYNALVTSPMSDRPELVGQATVEGLSEDE